MKRIRNYFSNFQYLFLLLIVPMIISPRLFAQNSGERKEIAAPRMKNGTWALQFQISQNFTLSDFQGSVLSLKKHLSAKTAIRLGIGIDIQTSDENNEFRRFLADTLSVSSNTDDNKDTHSINLATQFLYYPSSNNRIKPYWGAGPFIQYGHFKRDKNGQNDLTMDRFVENRDRSDWEFGVSTLIGVEWFVTSKISLLAEYGISFAHFAIDTREVTRQIPNDPALAELRTENQNNSDGFIIRALPVRFGLSVYW